MLMLPNGTFLYPKKLCWIRAFRKGAPPDLWVELHCQPIDGDVQVERMECETWDQVDGIGNVLARSMAEFFPDVPISFLNEDQP